MKRTAADSKKLAPAVRAELAAKLLRCKPKKRVENLLALGVNGPKRFPNHCSKAVRRAYKTLVVLAMLLSARVLFAMVLGQLTS